jgi:purine-binding chemotaxis protein CheW
MQEPIQNINPEKISQLVIFHIGTEEFGVPIGEIQEIIKMSNITPIPDAPEFIKGIINVRGDIVTVIDLKTRFSIHQKQSSIKHIVITKQYENLFGLIVDEVTEVLRISKDEIKFPPTLSSKIKKDYFSGVIVFDNRLIILLDLAKILSEEEFSRLVEMSSSFKGEISKKKNENDENWNDENIIAEDLNKLKKVKSKTLKKEAKKDKNNE